MKTPLLVFLTAFALSITNAVAQSPPPEHEPVYVVWEGDLDEALSRGKRLGRPVLVVFFSEGQRGIRTTLADVYWRPSVRRLLRELICVVGCESSTPTLEEGPRKGMSATFQTVTVKEHESIAALVRTKYLGKDEFAGVQHLFLDKDGHLIERVERVETAAKLAATLTRILNRLDPGWDPRATDGPPEAARPRRANGGAEGAVPWAGLLDKDEDVRDAAVRQLLDQADKSVVLTVYRDVRAAKIKAKILEAARRQEALDWVAPLVQLGLGDKDVKVRNQAAVTAEAAARKELFPTLRSRLQREKDDYARVELVRAIGACAHGDKRAIQAVTKEIRANDDDMRAGVYIALAWIGKGSKAHYDKMVDLLIKRGLKDRDGSTRTAAVWALGELRAKKAQAPIRKILERQRRMRQPFWRSALDRINGKDPEGWTRWRRHYANERIER